MKRIFFVFLILLFSFSALFAATYTVGSGGDFETLALAVADGGIKNGDVFSILDGSHVADGIVPPCSSLTFMSQSGDKTKCLIKNSATDNHMFNTGNVVGTRFLNLEFRTLGGSFNIYDGCVLYVDGVDATLYVEGCEFSAIKNGFTGSCGAASHIVGAARVEFVGCVFDSCCVPADMGTCGAVIIAETKITRIRNCVFSYNEAPSVAFGRGGALGLINSVTVADSATIVSGCLFIGNNGGIVDAALRIQQTDTDVEVKHCTFIDNITGGALTGNISSSVQVNCTLTVTHCIVIGGNAYAVNSNGNITTAQYINTINTAEDHVFAGSVSDTFHINPTFNVENIGFNGYIAVNRQLASTHDGKYIGWKKYMDSFTWHNNGYYKIRRRLFFF